MRHTFFVVAQEVALFSKPQYILTDVALPPFPPVPAGIPNSGSSFSVNSLSEQNLEVSSAGEALMVSLGQGKGHGLWSWTELNLNPSSGTSGLVPRTLLCAEMNGKCPVQGWMGAGVLSLGGL